MTHELRQPIPLRQRPLDIAILVFFLVNLLFITYVVDLEQLVIANPAHFTYPIWPVSYTHLTLPTILRV